MLSSIQTQLQMNRRNIRGPKHGEVEEERGPRGRKELVREIRKKQMRETSKNKQVRDATK